jgi:hypothetical protein
VRIAGVNLRKIQAKKGEANTWLLQFTATWTLGDPKEAITMIQRLKLGVYLTFVDPGTPAGPAGPRPHVVDGEVVGTATVDGGGNVTSIKRGRRRKKTPEQEGADQEAEARKQLPAGDPAGDDEPSGGDEPPAAGDQPATE